MNPLQQRILENLAVPGAGPSLALLQQELNRARPNEYVAEGPLKAALADLVASGIVEQLVTGHTKSYQLVHVPTGGPPSWPSATLEAAADHDPETGEVADERGDERFERERKLRLEAERKLEVVTAWLAERNIAIDGIVAAPQQKPARKTFRWRKRVIVDAAEKGRLFDETLALRRELALAEHALLSAKGLHKGTTERLNEEIEAIQNAAADGVRELQVEAYKEVDWEHDLEVVRAVADDRELERRPIERGEQRTIPGAGVGVIDEAVRRIKDPDGTGKTKVSHTLSDVPARTVEPNGHAGPLTSASLEEPILEMLRGLSVPLPAKQLAEYLAKHLGKPVGPGVGRLASAAVGNLIQRGDVLRSEYSGELTLSLPPRRTRRKAKSEAAT